MREGQLHRLTPFGQLDLATAPILEREFHAVHPDQTAEMIVVDLIQLTFMDSTGINLLARLNVLCEHDDRLRVINGSPAAGAHRKVVHGHRQRRGGPGIPPSESGGSGCAMLWRASATSGSRYRSLRSQATLPGPLGPNLAVMPSYPSLRSANDGRQRSLSRPPPDPG